MSYEAELNKLNELLTRSHSSASLRDRQAFQEYLLHLASLPSYDTKSRFATHIHRTFATFDQDQDPVIDAVMDLCEDRDVKIRILGIKALKTTATADSRWVKGNIGVLLQLLDSSGEELREVHKSLKSLITVDPVVAFQSIAKDLLSDDAGVSRSKVIQFLWDEAKPERREILQSGKNVEAERAFQKAFEEVLSTLKKGSDDYKDIDDMLHELSIRRRRRSPSPRRDSHQARQRSPNPPSRLAGPSSGRLPPQGDDRYRQQLPSGPATGPRREGVPTGPVGSKPRSPPRGPSGPASYSRGPPAGPQYSRGGPSYHQSSSSGYRDNRPPGPAYRPNDYRDRPQDNRDRGRSDRLPRMDDRYPSGPDHRYRQDSPERYRSNDRRARSPERPRHSDRRSRSRSRSPPRTRGDNSRDRDGRPATPQKEKPLASLDSRSPKATYEKTDEKSVNIPVATEGIISTTNGGAQLGTSASLAGVSALPVSLPDDRKSEAPVFSIRGESKADQGGKLSLPNPTSRHINIAGTARPDSYNGKELLSSAPPNISAAESASVSAPTNADVVDPAPVRALMDRLAPITPRSLADRIGEASSGKGKRRRDADPAVSTPVDSPGPALASRISSSHDVNASRDTKKPRISLPGSADPKASLLSRMSGGPGSAPSTPSMGPPSTPNAGRAPGSELSIRNASAVRNGHPSAGFSIKGATPTPSPSNGGEYFPQQTSSGATATPTPSLAKTMFIKSAGVTVANPAQSTAAPPVNPDEGIRRKGRGFSRVEEVAASIFQLPTPTSKPNTVNGLGSNGGGLASRLSGRK